MHNGVAHLPHHSAPLKSTLHTRTQKQTSPFPYLPWHCGVFCFCFFFNHQITEKWPHHTDSQNTKITHTRHERVFFIVQHLSPKEMISQKGLLIVNRERAESRGGECVCVSKRGWIKNRLGGKEAWAKEKGRKGVCTCWALAWFWSSIWSRAAERAGLASRGTVGAAPRRPAHKENIKIHSTRTNLAFKPLRAAESHLTLFVSLWQWVEQHLEGGRVVKACEYLHGRGIREETFTPIHSLEGRGDKTANQHKCNDKLNCGDVNKVHQVDLNTIVWAAISAANMLLPGGPGAQKDTLMCVPPSSLPSVSRCASSAISAVANSNTANRRKLPSCPWANCREEKTKTAVLVTKTHDYRSSVANKCSTQTRGLWGHGCLVIGPWLHPGCSAHQSSSHQEKISCHPFWESIKIIFRARNVKHLLVPAFFFLLQHRISCFFPCRSWRVFASFVRLTVQNPMCRLHLVKNDHNFDIACIYAFYGSDN